MNFPYEQPSQHLDCNLEDGQLLLRSPGRTLVRQLPDLSWQPHVRLTSPGDVARRFKDEAAAERWVKEHQRVFYALAGKNGTELGIGVGLRPRPLPYAHKDGLPRGSALPNHTGTIRLYEGYQNQQLGRTVMSSCILNYITTMPENGINNANFKGIWMKVRHGNDLVRNVCEDLGFQAINSDRGRDIMVLSPSQIIQATSQG